MAIVTWFSIVYRPNTELHSSCATTWNVWQQQSTLQLKGCFLTSNTIFFFGAAQTNCLGITSFDITIAGDFANQVALSSLQNQPPWKQQKESDCNANCTDNHYSCNLPAAIYFAQTNDLPLHHSPNLQVLLLHLIPPTNPQHLGPACCNQSILCHTNSKTWF